MLWNVNAVTLAHVILSSVEFLCGWRQEFNHCILLSLTQVHSDILLKDEICWERVIRSFTEAEPFQFPSTASFINRWLILISGVNTGPFFLILLNTPLTSEQRVRMGLCCLLACTVRFVALTELDGEKWNYFIPSCITRQCGCISSTTPWCPKTRSNRYL